MSNASTSSAGLDYEERLGDILMGELHRERPEREAYPQHLVEAEAFIMASTPSDEVRPDDPAFVAPHVEHRYGACARLISLHYAFGDILSALRDSSCPPALRQKYATAVDRAFPLLFGVGDIETHFTEVLLHLLDADVLLAEEQPDVSFGEIMLADAQILFRMFPDFVCRLPRRELAVLIYTWLSTSEALRGRFVLRTEDGHKLKTQDPWRQFYALLRSLGRGSKASARSLSQMYSRKRDERRWYAEKTLLMLQRRVLANREVQRPRTVQGDETPARAETP